TMRYPRAYPTDLPILADLLSEIQTPVQIINGAHDPVVPPVNAEYLHQRLPKSKLDLLHSGHFAWEDRADAYAALITSWWAEGCTTFEIQEEETRAEPLGTATFLARTLATRRAAAQDHTAHRLGQRAERAEQE